MENLLKSRFLKNKKRLFFDRFMGWLI